MKRIAIEASRKLECLPSNGPTDPSSVVARDRAELSDADLETIAAGIVDCRALGPRSTPVLNILHSTWSCPAPRGRAGSIPRPIILPRQIENGSFDT